MWSALCHESMNCHIDVESIEAGGTKFTLSLPLTLLIATALMVRAGVSAKGFLCRRCAKLPC